MSDKQSNNETERYRKMAVEGRRALASIKGILAQSLDGDSLAVTDAMVQIERIVDDGLEAVRPALVRTEQEREEKGGADA